MSFIFRHAADTLDTIQTHTHTYKLDEKILKKKFTLKQNTNYEFIAKIVKFQIEMKMDASVKWKFPMQYVHTNIYCIDEKLIKPRWSGITRLSLCLSLPFQNEIFIFNAWKCSLKMQRTKVIWVNEAKATIRRLPFI